MKQNEQWLVRWGSAVSLMFSLDKNEVIHFVFHNKEVVMAAAGMCD